MTMPVQGNGHDGRGGDGSRGRDANAKKPPIPAPVPAHMPHEGSCGASEASASAQASPAAGPAGGSRRLAFTPPVLYQQAIEVPTQFSLEVSEDGDEEASFRRRPRELADLEELPRQVEQWASRQREMHTTGEAIALQLQPTAKTFGLVTFVLTQGSGKDKVFKLLQNIALLVHCYARSPALRSSTARLEDQLSRSRKVLRTFKVFSEINKILVNNEEDPVVRLLMRLGNSFSVMYFLLDHVVAFIGMELYTVENLTARAVRWYRNAFSTLRLMTAFVIDTMLWRMGVAKEKKLRARLAEVERDPAAYLGEPEEVLRVQGDLDAVLSYRDILRRNFLANFINMTLLLNGLGAPGFKELGLKYIATGGIVTAILGIYKLVRRVQENQLALQF